MKELEKEFEAVLDRSAQNIGLDDAYNMFWLYDEPKVIKNIVLHCMNSAYQMGAEADKWISVGDGLPKEDCYIWAHSSISGEDERVWFEPELSQAFKNSHSHWMPLPKPPKNK